MKEKLLEHLIKTLNFHLDIANELQSEVLENLSAENLLNLNKKSGYIDCVKEIIEFVEKQL